MEEGLAKTVFMGRDMGLEQFIFMVKNPRNLFGFVFKEQECCGFAWLNRIDDNSAHAHFGLFQKTWGNTSDVIGKMFLDYWMTLGTDSELLDVIFGVIPLHNKLAQAFVQRIGFAYLGTIPGIIRVPGDKVSATIYFYLRR